MALAQRIPIILCGKQLKNGIQVTELIKPDFEVIQFVNSFDYAKAELGNLIAGREPQTPSSNNVGTHNYTTTSPPRAIMFGRGYSPEQVKELNRLFRGKGSLPVVAWIAGDPGFVLPAQLPPDYAVEAAGNVKRGFEKWKQAGGDSEDIVYY